MKSEKLKRYQVTQSLRFPSNIMKGFFYAGLILLPLGIIVAILGIFIPALEGLRGLAISGPKSVIAPTPRKIREG